MRLRPETKRKLLKEAGWARHDRTHAGHCEERWQPPTEPGHILLSVTFATAWIRYRKEHPA